MYALKASFHVMCINMIDSDSHVNRDAGSFGIIIRNPARPANVHGNRDDVISSFVRMKIREWRDGGRELQDLARSAGFAKSTPSQVLLGTGIGAKTGPKFAKAFEYRSFDEMKIAAWEWWRQQGEAGKQAVALPKTEAMRGAIQAVLALGQGTREQVETVMAAYSHPRFHERNQDWWIQTLLAELSRDRETVRADKAQRAEINEKQRGLRAEHEKKAERAKRPAAAAKRHAS